MKTQVYNLRNQMAALATVAVMVLAPVANANAQEQVALSLMVKPAAYFATAANETLRTVVNSRVEIENEATLTVEKWMSDNQFWGVQTAETLEEEAPLVVERWMSNDELWSGNEMIEAEPTLAIEQWMECNHTWGVENANEVIEFEQPLALEKWMDCNNYWLGNKYCESVPEQLVGLDSPLNIEPWMNSNLAWGQEIKHLAAR